MMRQKASRFRGFGDRLRQLIGSRSQAEFARLIGITPQHLTRYLAGRIPDPKILARVAEVTGRSIDWLLLGQGAAEVLVEAARQLNTPLREGQSWPEKRSELAHTLSRAEYATMLEEAAQVAAEAPAVYQAHASTILSLIEHIQRLSPEEQETLARFLAALRSGDAQVKEHLINQMKVVERALMTRRSRAKKSETA